MFLEYFLQAVYCSRKCRTEAMAESGSHQIECSFLPSLVALQPDMDVYLALRIIAATDLSQQETFMKMSYDSVPEQTDTSKILDDDTPSYQFIKSLEGHENERTVEEKTELWVASVLVLKLLLSCSSFWGSSIYSNYIPHIGKEIMDIILKNQCNAHCVKESMTDSAKHSTSYEDIGFGVYGKLSLLNHSCSPNGHTCNMGRQKLLYSISSIEVGEEITISYGERFVSHSFAERERNLRNSYFFSCSCTACTNKWPKFDELPAKFALRCCKCSGMIDSTSFKCNLCQLLHKPGKKGGQNSKKSKKNQQAESSCKNIYDASFCQSKLAKAWNDYTASHNNITMNKYTDVDFRKIQEFVSLMDKFSYLPNKPCIEAQETLIKYYDVVTRSTDY